MRKYTNWLFLSYLCNVCGKCLQLWCQWPSCLPSHHKWVYFQCQETQETNSITSRHKKMVWRTYRKPQSAKLTKWSTMYKHADLNVRTQTNRRHGAAYLDHWIPPSLHNGQIRIPKIDEDGLFSHLAIFQWWTWPHLWCYVQRHQ